MRVTKWMECLEKLAPVSIACQWDNPGLLAGRGEKEVKKVLIALDATDEVVDMAVENQVDLLLTHHPLIFKAVKKVTDQDFIGRRLVKLIQADISYYAMHTNFDAAPGCMADLAAGRLGILEAEPLEVMGEMDGISYGIGKVGNLSKELTLKELADKVKERFGLSAVMVYGVLQSDGPVRRIAVCPGSGKGMTEAALKAGARVLITGDMGHHDGIDGAAQGLVIMDAGHYGLEHMFVDFMEAYCAEQIDSSVEIWKAPVEFPAVVW
ncbi:MAG: Nif3-like dinuclear metal center hexameric protein [Hungatella sp.]|nr:Nif3-like dinuclear metal center hexameric protein [Hungatella sp.]